MVVMNITYTVQRAEQDACMRSYKHYCFEGREVLLRTAVC